MILDHTSENVMDGGIGFPSRTSLRGRQSLTQGVDWLKISRQMNPPPQLLLDGEVHRKQGEFKPHVLALKKADRIVRRIYADH